MPKFERTKAHPMSDDRRSFLLYSAGAVAGLLLPGQFSGHVRVSTQPTGPESLSSSQQNLAFTGGYWFNGKGFAGQPSRNHTYSVAGVFTSKKPARIDSVIDLKTWFIVPPFGEAHNHNADFSSEEQWTRIKEIYLRDGIFYIKNPCNLPRAAAPLAGRVNIPASVDVVFAHGLLTATDGHLKDGYEASFLALSGDPIKDFTNVQRIEMKVKQGVVI